MGPEGTSDPAEQLENGPRARSLTPPRNDEQIPVIVPSLRGRLLEIDDPHDEAPPPPRRPRTSRAPKKFAPSPDLRVAAPKAEEVAARDLEAALRALLAGDFTVRVHGDAEVARLFDDLAARLELLAGEVARVERGVLHDGRRTRVSLGRTRGGWAEAEAALNRLAFALVEPAAELARVLEAVARGDLDQKLTLEIDGAPVFGEFRRIGTTVNAMIDRLRTFADEVSGVARAVGVEGKLGGQAKVPGARGTWRSLTDNVNQLAANLTTQVRAIADVATAVTKGDLTRTIAVEAQGEVAALKDRINEMIRNLRETTERAREQDWLKTNLARIGGLLQGQKDVEAVARLIMSEVTPLVSAHHGAFFVIDQGPVLRMRATYAGAFAIGRTFRFGEGLVGQCAVERTPIVLSPIPDGYLEIGSGLGRATPRSLIVLPIVFEGEVQGVLELASFEGFGPIHRLFLDQLTEGLGVVLNVIRANARTEDLLVQSQGLTRELEARSIELQDRQADLERTNAHLGAQAAELEEKARFLEEQKSKVEEKNREVELARASLEEKAEQLSLISRYKSEFLANMSHELRTPLNSLLILAKILADNRDGNLSPKQVEYASTIHAAGGDLLSLINEILDLSKVEAGKMQIDPREISIDEVERALVRAFGPTFAQKGLDLRTTIDPACPKTIVTDPQRLQQVLKNLLANAFKFTERGGVDLRIRPAIDRSEFGVPSLLRAAAVVAFEVEDTGIGIPRDQQLLVFEAFQQVDGGAARRYGGTGLGLSISREIARLLGGEIHLDSEVGRGSRFTLFLPDDFAALEPVGELEVVSPSARIVERPRPQVERAVVLVLEGEECVSGELPALIRGHGLEAVVAPRGPSAVVLAEDLAPVAIVLDLAAPVLAAFDLLARLSRSTTAASPVHVLTQTGSAERAHAFVWLSSRLDHDRLSAVAESAQVFLGRRPRSALAIGLDDDDRTQIAATFEGESVPSLVAARAALDRSIPDLVFASTEALGRETDPGALLVRGDLGADPPLLVVVASAFDHRAEAVLRRTFDVGSSAPPRTTPTSTLAPPPRSSREELDGKKILVVDDDTRNLFALRNLLEEAGAAVLTAEDGRGAIEILTEHPEVDVVLMDVMMPEMDGYETTRAIRAEERFRTLPIVALTAKALRDDRDRCIEAGASDYLPKPVDAGRLLDVIALWVRA
jgi:signal transduction histidine kinase/CheY-like chemotaxis protein/HAMP domain-containing protein